MHTNGSRKSAVTLKWNWKMQAKTYLTKYENANEILNKLQEASFAYERVKIDHQDALERAHNVALAKEECQRVIEQNAQFWNVFIN